MKLVSLNLCNLNLMHFYFYITLYIYMNSLLKIKFVRETYMIEIIILLHYYNLGQ